MSADVNLEIQITKKGDGDKAAAAGLELVARKADDAKDELAQLDRKLAETRVAMVAAGKTFAQTGDVSPFKALLKDERQLALVSRSLRRFVDDSTKVMEQGGEQAGAGWVQRLGVSLSSASVPAFGGLSSGMTTALAAGAIAAFPAISAALSGAVLAGVGGSVMALGIKSAAADPRVRDAWRAVGDQFKAGLADASTPFVEPLISAAGTLRQSLAGDVLPILKRSFGELAPEVDHLADGVAGFVHNLGPGLQSALSASAPVLRQLGDDLPRIGAAVGFFLDRMSDAGPGAVAFLHDLTTWIDLSIGSLGVLIDAGSKIYQVWHDLPIFGSGVVRWMTDLDSGAGQTKTAFFNLAEEHKHGADQAAALTEQLNRLQSALLAAQGSTLGVLAATREAASTFDAASNAANENRSSLDATTAAGLRHQQALQGAINSIDSFRERQLAAGKDVGWVKGQVEQMINTLERDSIAHGADRAAMDALADSWRRILGLDPNKTFRTNIITSYTTIGSPSPGSGVGGGTIGNIRYFEEKGGIIAAAQGMITSSPTVLFGERRTGQEAFVPKLGISHDRGLALADTAARWHGGRVVAGYGGGPRYGGAAPAGAVRVELTWADVPTGSLEAAITGMITARVADAGGSVQAAYGRRGH